MKGSLYSLKWALLLTALPIIPTLTVEITVAVASLFIDSTAATNIAYGEYFDYLQKNAAVEVYQAAQPDG